MLELFDEVRKVFHELGRGLVDGTRITVSRVVDATGGEF